MRLVRMFAFFDLVTDLEVAGVAVVRKNSVGASCCRTPVAAWQSPAFTLAFDLGLWSARTIRAGGSASCGVADQLIFMVQPVEHRCRGHAPARGQAMAGGLRLNQGR